MAQTITLEEAAAKLGITPEEMKKRLKTDPDFKRLSPMLGGGGVQFKLSAIEELARELGMASDPELPLAPMEDKPGSDDFKVADLNRKKPKVEDKPAKGADAPLEFESGTDESDAFSLADDPKPAAPKPASSGKLTPNKPAPSSKGMSDSSAGNSDSDVRLDGGKSKKGKGDEAAVPTEEIALDFSGPGSAVIKGGSSAKLSAPKTGGSSGKLAAGDAKGGPPRPASPDSSEFELSLDADSDDFELQMNTGGEGDEVELGTLPKEKGSGGSSNKASKSGINLREPSDSGISLEKSKDGEKSKDTKKTEEKKDDSDADVDFELSLDSSAIPSSTKLGAPKSGKLVLDDASSSEFELTLDDSGGSSLEQAALGSLEDSGDKEDKGDIFETDFEIPPMPDESASEAVALESDTDLEKSDFELAMDDSDVATEEPSESEVVLLEDEEAEAAPKSKKIKGKPKKKPEPTEEADVDVDLAEEPAEEEDDGSASKALKGAKGRKRGEEDEDEEAVPAGAIVERPTKPWGILPALFLAPALVVVLIGGIIGYEMLNTMWGYQQPKKPAAPLVRAIASQFDMELRDQ